MGMGLRLAEGSRFGRSAASRKHNTLHQPGVHINAVSAFQMRSASPKAKFATRVGKITAVDGSSDETKKPRPMASSAGINPARLGKDKESWDVLLVEERAAAEKLGWTPESWEDGDPPVCASAWETLDAEQRAAATALGYERVIWDLEEAAASDEDIVIKISDGKDIRRFTASTESMPISYSTIYENFPGAFVLGSKAYKLKYKDDEGDQITMSTDRDLADAVAYTKTLEPPVLRLTLEQHPADWADEYL